MFQEVSFCAIMIIYLTWVDLINFVSLPLLFERLNHLQISIPYVDFDK